MEETELTHQEENTTTAERNCLERASHIVSWVFNPFMATSVIFLMLFGCTYLKMLPHSYKYHIISTISSFTTGIPLMGTILYLFLNKWAISKLNERTARFVPYLLALLGHGFCIFTMYRMGLPHYMCVIAWIPTVCLIICTLVNLFWRISTHSVAAGVLVGCCISFSSLFHFNPLGWLCTFILLSGILGSARIIAGRHSLSEVIVGFCVGMFCGVNGILFI